MDILAEHIVDVMLIDVCNWNYEDMEKLDNKRELFKVAYRYAHEYITTRNIQDIDILRLTNKVVREYKRLGV